MTRRGGGEEGEVERERHDGDPAEPGRHRRLEVKAVAIQFSPSANCPTPNHQPRASAERSDGARSIGQSRR